MIIHVYPFIVNWKILVPSVSNLFHELVAVNVYFCKVLPIEHKVLSLSFSAFHITILDRALIEKIYEFVLLNM
jgi:hypothetical protein